MFSFRRGFSSLPLQVALVAGLYGQAVPQTPAPAKPAQTGSASVSTDLKKRAFVKRISVGATLSVLAQVPLLNGGYSEAKTNFILNSTTAAGGYRVGWGGNVQVRLPN